MTKNKKIKPLSYDKTKILSRYTLVKELGRGEWGISYLVSNTLDPTDLYVYKSQKILHTELDYKNDQTNRVYREIQFASVIKKTKAKIFFSANSV